MPQEAIAQVVRNLPRFEHPDLIVGTDNFSDAGVYRVAPDLCIVQSLDFFPPLVEDAYTFGQIAASNSLSDLYAMGATPTTALNIVGFPDDELPLDILQDILRGGAERISKAGAVLMGGHTVRDTEIKYGLSVTGTIHPDNLVTNSGAKPGHALVLSKPLGTGFITTAPTKSKCPAESYDAAVEEMVRLNDTASRAAVACGASAVTDITGFGLGGHAREMAVASSVTLEIVVDQLPALPGAVKLGASGFRTRASDSNRTFIEDDIDCGSDVDLDILELVFDPQTSGGLLVALPPEAATVFVQQVQEVDGHESAVIGQVAQHAGKSLRFS